MQGTTPPAKEKATPQTVSVSQLNAMIKQAVGDHLPGTVHLRGEISNLSRPKSGHIYLTLKDDASEIRVVMWRSAAASLKFDPKDGLDVVATGHVDHYEPRGQIQFYARKLAPVGVGSLELAFRQLVDKLKTEGLFDARHKKPIPRFPRRIGVITSESGAAIRDILHTIQRRFPCVNVMLHPVRVQGEGAAREIADAIHRLNTQADRLGGLDVLIVGRGGGSLEDLWAFNEEVVARAIHASRLPIISAVGHEVDVSIADMVADIRAPTPTAAAELATPVRDEELDMLASHAARMHRAARLTARSARTRLEHAAGFQWFRDPARALAHEHRRIRSWVTQLKLSVAHRLAASRRRMHDLHVALLRHRPQNFVRMQERELLQRERRMWRAASERIHTARWGLERHDARLQSVRPDRDVSKALERTNQLERRLQLAAVRALRRAEERLIDRAQRLDNSSHQRILKRGYTLTRRAGTGRIVTRAEQVQPGDRVVTQTSQGEFESRVLDAEQGELFE